MQLFRFLALLGVFGASVVNGFSLDRDAFTFTNYKLDVRIEPSQQRLAARGKITLRNDSAAPQKNLVLQISSSLSWRSIQLNGKPVQFVSQPYTSDVDHTGALSEAVVTLPDVVAPKSTVELEIGYEGVIPLDTTRLTRIGVPAEAARHSDWDQISESSTAVRGIGYVAWYPIATEAASLSDADSVPETIGNWKHREGISDFRINLCSVSNTPAAPLMSDLQKAATGSATAVADGEKCSEHVFSPLGDVAPVFAFADYRSVSRG